MYQETLSLGVERGARDHGYLSRVEAALAAVLLEQNELEQAEAHARTALEWTQWWPSANHRTLALAYLGRTRLAQGDLDAAAEAIEAADRERQRSPVLPSMNNLADACLVRLWLAQGKPESAYAWAVEASRALLDEAGSQRPFDESRGTRQGTLARVLLAQARTSGDGRRLDDALTVLDRMSAGARSSSHGHFVTEAEALRALALHLRSSPTNGSDNPRSVHPSALHALAESLRLAEPQGYVRLFADEGQPMAGLLRALLLEPASVGTAVSPAYLNRLLAAIPEASAGRHGQDLPALAEHLTERELDVLRLLAAGLSNRQMAHKLVVTEGTVKTHVHNLIAKLGAQSRTDVLARARALDLL
jgi:LuxR family maltose regulon positive regulatory protein